MNKESWRKRRNKKNTSGFTLVEVLAVIAVIAILGLIAIPNVINTIDASKQGSYQILIGNIKIAGQELYEELEYAGSTITDADGTTLTINKANQTVSITLQGLVNNGFLKGTNNPNKTGSNKHSKVILNPKNEQDIGACKITITKTKTSGKIEYTITNNSSANKICPTTEEYKK